MTPCTWQRSIPPSEIAAKTWVFKKVYRNIRHIATEYDAYRAIDGQAIAPGFGAKATDQNSNHLVEVVIILGYIETRWTDENNKNVARGAFKAVKMHDLGWVHGDFQNVDNVLIRASDGRAFLINFSNSPETNDFPKRRRRYRDNEASF